MLTLLVGLGNPGPTYARNRHNVGFMAVERIHDRWRGGPWRKKFQGEVAEAVIGERRVMFLKPMTFMNESGRAIAEAARFYKVASGDIVVAHDEIDLPPGKFRMKTGGGTGGHNGLKSVTAFMKDGYRRLRIGVGHPGRKEMVPGYVLHDFAKSDEVWLDPLLDALAEEAPLLVQAKDNVFASKVHERVAAAGSGVAAGRVANGNGNGAGREPAPAKADALPAGRRDGSGSTSGPFAALANFLKR